MPITVTLHLPDMCCPVEGAAAERHLKTRPEVAAVSFDYGSRRLTVTATEDAELDASALAQLLTERGLRAEVVADLPASRTVFSIPEMDCPIEAGEIERELAKEGITGAALNIMNRTMTLSADEATLARAKAAVERLGYHAVPMTAKRREVEDVKVDWTRYGAALVLALGSEAVELVHEYMPDALPIPETWVSGITLILALAAILLTGIGTFKTGLASIRHMTLNMNALMSVAVVGAVLIGAWPEAAMVMVLFEISEAIEQLAMQRARRSIRDLMSVTPEEANVLDASGRVTPTAVETIMPGARLRVAPGERIPLDGVIEKGETTLDQSAVTGEGLPAEKGPGATVWGGTVNLSATIEMRVTAAASESLTARIIDAVENAEASKSPVQRFVDRFAAVYTPIVFAVATATVFLPPIFFGDFMGWLYKGLCLLVIACPCALVISTPVTIVSALASATRAGLLIKGGLYLEEARKLRFVGLDKTGTLTKGEPHVAVVKMMEGADEKSALEIAGSLAAMSDHPLSQALAAHTRAQGLEPFAVEDFKAIPGAGTEGRVGRGLARLVNLRWLRAQELADEATEAVFTEIAREGMSATALADRFGVVAVFGFRDTVKPDAKAGIAALEAVGLEPTLLTGDTPEAANALGAELGLTHIRAGLLPDEKLSAIADMQKTGLTAMVGDGINDAPALAKADIGIAMGVRGTESAVEAAHVVVMDDRVSSIATLVRLSRMTHSVLLQNIVFAIGIKLIFAIATYAGMATMWMAVFADVGTCLIVVANGMRMLRANEKLKTH